MARIDGGTTWLISLLPCYLNKWRLFRVDLFMRHFSRSANCHFIAKACIALLAHAVALTPAHAAEENLAGEQIYRRMCASCHGPSGEGTIENYKHPLRGERSVAQLTRLISK